MALAYKKLTKEEDENRNLLEKGDYPFSVRSVTQKPTKSGENQQLEVELSFYDVNGRTFNIKDWIQLDMENMVWKLRHFCEALSLLESYEAGSLDARDFLGKPGVARLGISEYEKDGELRKGNKVLDYLKPKAAGNEIFNPDQDIPL